MPKVLAGINVGYGKTATSLKWPKIEQNMLPLTAYIQDVQQGRETSAVAMHLVPALHFAADSIFIQILVD